MKAFILLALLALASAEYPIRGSPAFINDNNVLQYALTLEHLEAAFYAQGLVDFPASNFPAELAYVRNLLVMIGDHETAHVNALSQILTARGATPVAPCNYTFDYSNLFEFLALANVLENTGVSAYDQTFRYITQTDLINLAAGVAAVEARHAAVLGRILAVENGPFPNATDIPLPPMNIFPLAAQFIAGQCASLIPVVTANYTIAGNFRNVSSYNQTLFNQTAAAINDINVLQYALTLEHLESAFYASAMMTIDSDTFANVTSDYDVDLIQIIAEQEAAHVLYLQSFIIARGGVPVAPCTYKGITFNNTIEGVQEFLVTAWTLESVGTAAYVGAHAYFTDATLLATAATVSTVEARHTAYLGYLLSLLSNDSTTYNPVGDVTNPAELPAAVIAAAGTFIDGNVASCITFALPVPADNFRPSSAPTTTTSSSSGSSSSGSSSSGSSQSTGSSTGSVTGSTTRTGTTTSQPSSANMVAVSMAVIAILALLF